MTEIHKPGTGAIFGIVTEEGVAKDASPVYLYDTRRWEGVGKKKLLGRRLTRPDGGFEFAGLNTAYGDYMVLATDEDGAEPKNALVQDRVTPLAAHSGAGNFAEWYTRAMRDGAQSGLIAWPAYEDKPGEVVPRGLFGRPVQSTVNLHTWVPHPSPPPEIPNLASYQCNPLGWGYHCTGRRMDLDHVGDSLECLLDLDSIATQEDSCIIGGFYGNGRTDALDRRALFSRLPTTTSWLGASRLLLGIEVSPAKLVSILYTPTWVSTVSNDSAWMNRLQVISTFDMSAFSGVRHVVISLTHSTFVKVYVDGVLVHTATTSSVGSAGDIGGGFGYSAFGFSSSKANNSATGSLRLNARDYRFSLGVYYNRALSDQDVQDHYKALYDNDLISVVSGYASAVFADVPHMYWRMDDFQLDERNEFASAINSLDPNTSRGFWNTRLSLQGPSAGVDPTVISPIAGRNAVGVVQANNNSFVGEHAGTFGFLFRDRGAISFWAKFDVETPSVAEFLAEFHIIDTDTPYFEVQRTTANQLQLRLRESGALQTHAFTTYVPPVGAWQHITIVIDKTGEEDASNGLLKLYVGDETNAPVLVQTLLITLQPIYTTDEARDTPVSNFPVRVRVMRQLTGSMCELAVFPDILTPARIEAHWNMRAVV